MHTAAFTLIEEWRSRLDDQLALSSSEVQNRLFDLYGELEDYPSVELLKLAQQAFAVSAPVPLRRTFALHGQGRTEFKCFYPSVDGQVIFKFVCHSLKL